jgi:HEAT repeat protein
VARDVIPALGKALATPNLHPAIRSCSLLALARAGGPPELLLGVARKADPRLAEISDWGLLALALMAGGDGAEIEKVLLGLLDDNGVRESTQAVAAVALGLRGGASPGAIEALRRQLDGAASTPDVPVAAITALGLLGEPSRGAELAGWLASGRIGPVRLSGLELAHLVTALARAGGVPPGPVLDVLRSRDTLVRRSAMIALGRMIPAAPPGEHAALARRLWMAVAGETDESARGFGLVSLGRIGAHPEMARGAWSGCRDALRATLGERNASARAYAAIGLGLLAGGPGPGEERGPLFAELRRLLADPKEGLEVRGAAALGLGLSGDASEATLGLLSGTLADRGGGWRVRGAAAAALGLLGDVRSGPVVLGALTAREGRDLRVETAVAAGIVAGPAALPHLLAVFDDPKASLPVLGAAAEAIGRLGDARAVPELVRILEPGLANGAYPDLIRQMAVTALGLLCERPEARVLHRLSADLNYRAMVPVLEVLLSVK